MTRQERLACFRHAKRHALESIVDTLVDENHSVLHYDGKARPDMQAEVMKQLEKFRKQIKRTKWEA